MSRAIALAERIATPALTLLAAANLLFFVLFVIAIVAAGRARAEAPACTGVDMLSALERDDPAKFAAIKAEAAGTPNGSGLLWKVEKAGAEASYLFGTMHMTDPRVTTLPPAAQKAFDASDTVVIETTEVLDQSKMMAALAAQPDLMMFTDATTLPSLLDPDQLERFNAALAARGVPPASVAKMKPWMLAAMLALPACELARKASGAPVLDVELAREAGRNGKTLEGLETMADQLGAMASLPMDFHIRSLVETLKLGDRMNDVVETMIVLYQRGETAMYWPLFRAVLPDGGEDGPGYAEFEEKMVVSRNRTMAEHAEPLLARGRAFIAVGALHLPGQDGLIELLRRDGYTVSPAG